MDQEERPAGVGDILPDLLAGPVERRDRAADGDAAVAGDLGGDPADPADVGLPVGLGEGEPGRQVPPDDVTVEAGQRPSAALEQAVHQGLGERGLAAAGEAGEEEHQALLGRRRSLLGDDRGDGRGRRTALGELDHRVLAGVVRHHRGPQPGIAVRVAVVGQRHRDHRDVQVGGSGERGAQQADRGQSTGAAADEGEHQDRAEVAEPVDLLLGRCVGDRHDGAAGVLLAGGGGGEVESAEGAVLGVGERLDSEAAAVVGDPGEGEALGVDQLDRATLGEGGARLLGQRQRHRTAGSVEPVDRLQSTVGEQLQVVELTRRRAVLRRGVRRHAEHPAKESRITRLFETPCEVMPATRRRRSRCERTHLPIACKLLASASTMDAWRWAR